MTNDLNKTVHSGRFVNDPELKIATSRDGKTIPTTNFTLAINKYMGKDREPEVIFADFVAYRRMAEFITKWFRKGDEAIIFGKLSIKFYPSKVRPGEKVRVINIVAEDIYFGQRAKANQPSADTYGKIDFAPPPPSDDDIPEEYMPDDDLPF